MPSTKNTSRRKTWSEEHQVPLYKGCGLYVIVCDSPPQALKDFSIPGEWDETGAACCIRNKEGGQLIIFGRPYITIGVIVHECCHATSNILEFSGWEHTRDTEEPFSYLLEWVIETVVADLKKHKERIG